MNNRFGSILFLLCAAIAVNGMFTWTSSASTPRVETFVGYAYSADDDGLVYTEHHEREWQADKPVRMQTTYRLPNGERFAERTVDYLEGGRVSFQMKDERIGYREGAKLAGDQLELFVQRGAEQPRQTDAIDLAEDLIVDAGFDSFVRQHFDRLLQGDAVEARFAVPSRRAAYDCEIELVEELTIDGAPAVTLRLRFKGFLLSLFADPVDVSYHRDTGQLLRYVGVSNLRDTDGDNYQVRIELPLSERGEKS
jgi:hypothetical protein